MKKILLFPKNCFWKLRGTLIAASARSIRYRSLRFPIFIASFPTESTGFEGASSLFPEFNPLGCPPLTAAYRSPPDQLETVSFDYLGNLVRIRVIGGARIGEREAKLKLDAKWNSSVRSDGV